MSNEPHFEVYPRRHRLAVDPENPGGPPVEELTGDYGWRFVAANGQITAVGGEGFTRAEDAERALRAFVGAVVEITTSSVEASMVAATKLPIRVKE